MFPCCFHNYFMWIVEDVGPYNSYFKYYSLAVEQVFRQSEPTSAEVGLCLSCCNYDFSVFFINCDGGTALDFA